MKQHRSIFWPLVVIAAGTLLLLYNLGRIDSSNFAVLAQIWPVALIGLGLAVILGTRWQAVGHIVVLLTVALLFVAIVFAPQLGLTRSGYYGTFLVNRGPLVVEERAVSAFDQIVLAFPAEVVIRQGEAESLTIEAAENVLAEIESEVRSGVLYIGKEGPGISINLAPSSPVHIDITVSELKAVKLSSAGSLRVEELNVAEFDLHLNGAGEVKLAGIDVEKLRCQIDGAGSLDANGKADSQEIFIDGFGSFKGRDLESQSAQVNISGAGSATVWALSRLSVHISGAGSVEYYGQPQVDQSISGAGSVRQAGDK